MIRHFTSREFNQDVAAAKRAAKTGPVVITDRGHPAHVLLSYGDFERLMGRKRSLADALSNSEVAVIEFDIPQLNDLGFRPAVFD